jgi:hypothetical protein
MIFSRRLVIKALIGFQMLKIFGSFSKMKHIFLVKKQQNLYWIISETDL